MRERGEAGRGLAPHSLVRTAGRKRVAPVATNRASSGTVVTCSGRKQDFTPAVAKYENCGETWRSGVASGAAGWRGRRWGVGGMRIVRVGAIAVAVAVVSASLVL